MRFLLPLLISLFAVSGCDQIMAKLGVEDPAKKEAKLESEGKAVGSACRQSGRAIEDCYAIYSWLPKSPIFEGWREMDTYMRDNKIETIEPQLPPPEPPGARKRKKPVVEEAAPEADTKEEKPADAKTEASAEKPAEKADEPTAGKTDSKPESKSGAKR